MNVLAHRNISQMEVRGTVEVNDRPIGLEISSLSAYIQQEDLFVGSLTVREHLTFQVNSDDLWVGVKTAREEEGEGEGEVSTPRHVTKSIDWSYSYNYNYVY